MRRIKDWTLLPGASIEIRQQGSYVCSGYVDAVTTDGEILWVSLPSTNRKLFEKAEFYEAWAFEGRTAFTKRSQEAWMTRGKHLDPGSSCIALAAHPSDTVELRTYLFDPS